MDSTPKGRAVTSLPTLSDAIACPLLDRDHEAWIRCCTARFVPIANRLAGDDAGAKDALQESWIAVLDSLWQYRGGSPACGWVRTIVRREALRQRAQRRREVPIQDDGRGGEPGLRPDSPPAPGIGAEDAEQVRQMVRILLEVIERLPPAYREVVRLRDLEECSPEAVAAQLHVSRSNVASRLHRAHALLRRRLRSRLGGRAAVHRRSGPA